jgi:outer membrane protein assembly factor BamB
MVYLTVQTEEVKPYKLAIPSRHPPFWTGRIMAMDLATGKQRWQHAMAGEAINQLAVYGPHLAYLEAGILSGPTSRKPVSFGVLDAATGATRWTKTLPPGTEWPVLGAGMMIAMFTDRLWLATRSLSSYDLMTGKVLSNVSTPGNPACAPPRLTVKAMAHAQGGYANLEDLTMRQPRITRGSCGTAPAFAYGLQFFTPNRCTCSTFLRGHVALATEATPAPVDDKLRLEKGDAPAAKSPAAAPPPDGVWPAFLAGPQRWSSVRTEFPQKLALAWTIRPAEPPVASSQIQRDWTLNNLYNGPVVGPVTDGARLVIALPQQHTVEARTAATGELQWAFLAGGRIDTPPTLDGDRVYFGCRDGYVYALDAASGKLAWRFLAARSVHRMVAYGQVESKWPVHGAVLLHGGLVVAAAGYHPQVDGGITVWALDPSSGEPKWKHVVAHEPPAVKVEKKRDHDRWPFPPTDNTTFQNNYNVHNLVRNDVLQSSGELALLPGYAMEGRTGEFAEHFVALDLASGYHRPLERIDTYLWSALFMNHRLSNYSGPGDNKKPYLAVRTPDTAPRQILGSSIAVDGASVFVSYDGPFQRTTLARYDGQARRDGGEPARVWSHTVTGWRSAAIAVTTDRLLVVLEELGPLDQRMGVLQVRDRKTGDVVQEIHLPAAPGQNTLAAANGSVYLTLLDGRVLCFNGRGKETFIQDHQVGSLRQ